MPHAILLPLVVAATTPARTCPQAVCVLEVRAVAAPMQLPQFSFELEAPRDDASMPPLWRALRTKVYSELPRVEGERGPDLTFAPVVITGSFDTIPGLGFEGEF